MYYELDIDEKYNPIIISNLNKVLKDFRFNWELTEGIPILRTENNVNIDFLEVSETYTTQKREWVLEKIKKTFYSRIWEVLEGEILLKYLNKMNLDLIESEDNYGSITAYEAMKQENYDGFDFGVEWFIDEHEQYPYKIKRDLVVEGVMRYYAGGVIKQIELYSEKIPYGVKVYVDGKVYSIRVCDEAAFKIVVRDKKYGLQTL